MNLFLLYYKLKELIPIVKEKKDNDNIYLLSGHNYNQLVEKYSKFPSRLKLWYILGKLMKILHKMDISMMDVNLYYPYINLNQIIFPKTPLIWRLGGNIFVENAKRIGHPFFGNEVYIAGGKLFLFLSRQLLENCSAIVTHSNWLKREIQKQISNKNIFVIYENVDTKQFNPHIDKETFRKSFGFHKDQVILLSVMKGSFFQKIKGLFYYFKVIKRLNEKFGKKISFLICGTGIYYPYLQKYAAKMKINNIHFLGFQHNMNKIYAACDIFVHPTLLDAAPRVIREAGISRKPIVASNVGGIPELIDAKCSFLIDLTEQDEFYNILKNLIENKELREEFGKRAYNFINLRNMISSGKLFWKIFNRIRA